MGRISKSIRQDTVQSDVVWPALDCEARCADQAATQMCG